MAFVMNFVLIIQQHVCAAFWLDWVPGCCGFICKRYCMFSLRFLNQSYVRIPRLFAIVHPSAYPPMSATISVRPLALSIASHFPSISTIHPFAFSICQHHPFVSISHPSALPIRPHCPSTSIIHSCAFCILQHYPRLHFPFVGIVAVVEVQNLFKL